MVDRQVVHRAVQPTPGLAHLLELRVQPKKCLLYDVLSHVSIRQQPQGIAQQGRLQCLE
jgi:hypothetical protein